MMASILNINFQWSDLLQNSIDPLNQLFQFMARYISYNCYLVAESDKVQFRFGEEEVLPDFYK